jgi:hypothetical protein
MMAFDPLDLLMAAVIAAIVLIFVLRLYRRAPR